MYAHWGCLVGQFKPVKIKMFKVHQFWYDLSALQRDLEIPRK